MATRSNRRAADAKAKYRREVAKLEEYKEVLTFAHGTGNEDSIARADALHSKQKSRVFDAKLEWDDAEGEVRQLAKEIMTP